MSPFCRLLRWLGLPGCPQPAPPAPLPSPPAPLPPAPAVQMLFLTADAPTNTIATMSAGGLNKKVLVRDGMTPNWTPAGKIIFVALRGSPQIWVMDADGGNQRQVSYFAWSGVEGGPIMPQQGKNGLIVFQKQMPAGSEIHSIDVTGADEKVLVGMDQKPSQPSLAQSGTWLTYTAESPPPNISREIRRINIDGTGEIALTMPGDPDYPHANASNISKDETLVAFFSGTEQLQPGTDPRTWGYRNIATVPATGGPRMLITNCVPINRGGGPDGVAADNPFWLPDGRIGYDRDDGHTWASALPIGGKISKPTQIIPMSRGPVRVVVKP